MRKRCANPKDSNYPKYGGLGVKVCNEWNEYLNFYNWSVNNGYEENLTIDRIKSDGNYEPANCRWTTYSIQSANTRLIRKNNTSGFRGVTDVRSGNKRFKSTITINNKLIYLGKFFTKTEAAKAYNQYIISNKLSNPLNTIPNSSARDFCFKSPE